MLPVQRQFLYMPLMHSEAMADQVESLRLFTVLGERLPGVFSNAPTMRVARWSCVEV